MNSHCILIGKLRYEFHFYQHGPSNCLKYWISYAWICRVIFYYSGFLLYLSKNYVLLNAISLWCFLCKVKAIPSYSTPLPVPATNETSVFDLLTHKYRTWLKTKSCFVINLSVFRVAAVIFRYTKASYKPEYMATLDYIYTYIYKTRQVDRVFIYIRLEKELIVKKYFEDVNLPASRAPLFIPTTPKSMDSSQMWTILDHFPFLSPPFTSPMPMGLNFKLTDMVIIQVSKLDTNLHLENW